MVKKADLCYEFERFVRAAVVSTPLGLMRVHAWSIRIHSVGSHLYDVALHAHNGASPVSGFVAARSYPMSYKSAYRLVCSL